MTPTGGTSLSGRSSISRPQLPCSLDTGATRGGWVVFSPASSAGVANQSPQTSTRIYIRTTPFLSTHRVIVCLLKANGTAAVPCRETVQAPGHFGVRRGVWTCSRGTSTMAIPSPGGIGGGAAWNCLSERCSAMELLFVMDGSVCTHITGMMPFHVLILVSRSHTIQPRFGFGPMYGGIARLSSNSAPSPPRRVACLVMCLPPTRSATIALAIYPSAFGVC